MSDVLFVVPETLIAWRITTKRLTVGDGIAVDTLQDELTNRLDGREMLKMVNQYALLKFATARVETAQLDCEPGLDADGSPVMPDTVQWHEVEITESLFMGLDEYLSYLWVSKVLEKNPHRDQSYELLKKNLIAALQAQMNASATNNTPLNVNSSGSS